MGTEGRSAWTDPAWLRTAAAWIGDHLDVRGLAPTGPIEQPHVYPWATVLRIPVTGGVVWFKAGRPSVAHEPGVLRILTSIRPDVVPVVLAADPARGWLLLDDAGTRLRELGDPGDLADWERMVALYAELQVAASPLAEDLIAAGAPDLRLPALPGLLEAVLEDRELLRVGHPEGLTEEEEDRLRAAGPVVRNLCGAVAAAGLPSTIQHDDFHDGNVCVRDGAFRIIDWGDSSVSHPFFSLTVALRVLAWRFGLDEAAPEIRRVEDAYLEPWTAHAPRPELARTAAVARHLGMMCRAITWHAGVSEMAPEDRPEYIDSISGWLQDFLSGGVAPEGLSAPPGLAGHNRRE